MLTKVMLQMCFWLLSFEICMSILSRGLVSLSLRRLQHLCPRFYRRGRPEGYSHRWSPSYMLHLTHSSSESWAYRLQPFGFHRQIYCTLASFGFLCTHVNNFKIVAKSPEHWLHLIKDRFLVKQSGPPEYYLGNDYRFEEQDQLWTMGCDTYTKEAIQRTEELHGCLRIVIQNWITPRY